MNTGGRPHEKKLWDTSFRQVFTTNFIKDPDLHILLFLSGEKINDVMRDALREYMVKHGNKAIERDFQTAVFMSASRLMSQGVRPVASDVLAEMSQKHAGLSTAVAPHPHPGRADETEIDASLSAPVTPVVALATPDAAVQVTPVATQTFPEHDDFASQSFEAPPVEAAAMARPSSFAPAETPAPATSAGVGDQAATPAHTPPVGVRPKPAFDFGVSPASEGLAPDAASPVNQRDKWLARAKF